MAQEPVLTAKAPQTAPAQAKAPITGNCDQYRSLVAQYDWDITTILAVMRAESGCNPGAANWSDGHNGCKGSFGLMQIACIHGASPDTTPEQNIEMAYHIYSTSGLSPWGAYTDLSYLKYL